MEIDEQASTRIQSRPAHVIPGYRIAEELGRGGMGVVYRATHLELQREVALKVVLPSRRIDPEFALRFLREARTVASLNHPHVVQAYDAGTANGVIYLALELVDGEDVGTYLRRRGQLAPREATQIVLDAARGLAHAYGSPARVIHRDVKPGNLLRTTGEDGSPLIKLTDFGLARSVHSGSDLTQSGVIMGSPRYMSPEQALGQPVDHRSDIYSLGATFYELLVGHPPLSGSPVQVLAQLVSKASYPAPSELLEHPVSPRLEGVLARMLEHDRDARYADYASLIADLEALLADSAEPAAWPRARSVRAALAGCAAALTGLVLACSSPNPAPAPAAEPAPTARPAEPEVAARPAEPEVAARTAEPEATARTAEPTDPQPAAPAAVERCTVQLQTGVPGAQAFVDGEPVALPAAITAERGAELELVVAAPGHIPLRRVVRAEDRTLQLDPHPSFSDALPRIARGALFPDPPRTRGKRPLVHSVRGQVVAIPSEEGAREPAQVDELVATGEGLVGLPLGQAAEALADAQGQTAAGWTLDFALRVQGDASLELMTLVGDARDLVLRIRGRRLELGARSADGYTALGTHDLVHTPRMLRLEWTGTRVRVSSRAADTVGVIFRPVFSQLLDWTPTALNSTLRVYDVAEGAEVHVSSLTLEASGAPVAPRPRDVGASERLRLTSRVAGARAFVDGQEVALPHALEVSLGSEVQCVVVAPGHAPLRRVLGASDRGEVRLDPAPTLEAPLRPAGSRAVFPWLPDARQGVWHVVHRVDADQERRVPSYAVLGFDNRQASLTATLGQRLAELAQEGEVNGWSVELDLEVEKPATAFELTALRGAEGALALRLRDTRLELLERTLEGATRVVAIHDLVSPPTTLRLDWDGSTVRVLAATLLGGGRLRPALACTPAWSDLEAGSATFAFDDVDGMAILECPQLTLLRP